ncbi:Crp/Fnr family transcriptional regulator [Hwanghaeella grinnelliae]|nr:Crp/Fnr family transcriptional regulator [Hwanghaeella grinnelliae]
MSDSEERFIDRLDARTESFGKNDQIVSEGDAYSKIYVIKKGWTYHSRTLDDGRRQITRIDLPGDICCFFAPILKYSANNIVALTDCEMTVLELEQLAEIYTEQPGLGAALSWCCAQDESVLSERLVSVGRRSAVERLAHFFVEIRRRMELVDLAEGNRFLLPVTREQLADAMGITTVHLFRSMRRLEKDQIIAWGTDGVAINDMMELHRIAKFTEPYLHYTEIPSRTDRFLKKLSQIPQYASGQQ